MQVELTGKFVTVPPIKPKPKLAGAGWDYVAWRMHVYRQNLGTYPQIDGKVMQGKLKAFTCTDKTCDCPYTKL